MSAVGAECSSPRSRWRCFSCASPRAWRSLPPRCPTPEDSTATCAGRSDRRRLISPACRLPSRSPWERGSPCRSARRMSRHGSAVGGWPVKLAFLLFVMGLQLRGASEAVGLTVAVGVVALVILVAFCLFMAPEYQSARLFSVGTRRCEDAAAAWDRRRRALHPVRPVSVSRRRTGGPRRGRNARHGPQHAQGACHGDRRRLRDRHVRAADRDRRDRRRAAGRRR